VRPTASPAVVAATNAYTPQPRFRSNRKRTGQWRTRTANEAYKAKDGVDFNGTLLRRCLPPRVHLRRALNRKVHGRRALVRLLQRGDEPLRVGASGVARRRREALHTEAPWHCHQRAWSKGRHGPGFGTAGMLLRVVFAASVSCVAAFTASYGIDFIDGTNANTMACIKSKQLFIAPRIFEEGGGGRCDTTGAANIKNGVAAELFIMPYIFPNTQTIVNGGNNATIQVGGVVARLSCLSLSVPVSISVSLSPPRSLFVFIHLTISPPPARARALSLSLSLSLSLTLSHTHTHSHSLSASTNGTSRFVLRVCDTCVLRTFVIVCLMATRRQK
jgi:hypothetical protein